MAETKINANQTNITASDIGAASTAQLADKQDTMQYSNFPGHPSSSSYPAETTSEWEGKIIQYTGSKRSGSLWPGGDAVINTGTFLRAVLVTSGTPRASATYTSSTITSVTVNATTFVDGMKQYIPNHDFVGENRFVYDADSWGWVLQPEGVVISEFWPNWEAAVTGMRALGISISPEWGEFQSGDTIVVTISGVTKKYYWKPVNVDSTALVNNSTNSRAISICGNSDTQSNSINIGYNSSASKGAYGDIAIGDSCNVVGSTESYGQCQTIGIGNSITVAGPYNIAIGGSIFKPDTYTEIGRCVVIGKESYISANNASFSTVIGYNAVSEAFCAIQLGSRGDDVNRPTNSDANTFKVANQNGNFEMMSADGTIPVARLTNIISDSSTTATNQTWSASKLNATIGDIETLINAL